MRWAPLFQDVITPWRVLLTIASSDDSMMAANRAWASMRGSTVGNALAPGGVEGELLAWASFGECGLSIVIENTR
jgi:hypothetical protein